MRYVRALRADEREALRRTVRTAVGRVSERSRRVLLADRHYNVPQLAAIFACTEATVRHWLARFESEGVAGRADRPRTGRPRKAAAAARARSRQALDATPAAAG